MYIRNWKVGELSNPLSRIQKHFWNSLKSQILHQRETKISIQSIPFESQNHETVCTITIFYHEMVSPTQVIQMILGTEKFTAVTFVYTCAYWIPPKALLLFYTSFCHCHICAVFLILKTVSSFNGAKYTPSPPFFIPLKLLHKWNVLI